MKYTREQKRKIFDSLPRELADAIMSTDTSEKLRIITDQNSLMLDQAAGLGDEVGLLMLGITKQNDFVKNLSQRLNISQEKANQIARDVNTEILDSVRDSLKKIQDRELLIEESKVSPQETTLAINTPTIKESALDPQQTISSIEHAGDFVVEKTQAPSSSSQYKETNIDREALLKHIEDGLPAVPLVDHLLTTPINNEQKKVQVVKTENKTYTADPYREQI